MPAPAIQVRGLREVTNALRKVDREIPKGFRGAFLPIARRVVAGVKGAVNADAKNPTGRAASSVTARASQRGAAVSFGGATAPYFPWLDFGGTTGRGHIPGQAWSGSIKRPWAGHPVGSGRYVYPTIEEQREEIMATAEEAVLSAARAAGFEVQ